MNKEPIIILTTVKDKGEAESMAKALLDNHLAACVSILSGVQSIYRWNNKIYHEKEHQLLIKTVQIMEQHVYALIRKLHSYEVPEIMTLPVQSIDTSYKNWIVGEVSG